MAENLNLKGNKFCLNHMKEKIKFLCEDCKQKICITCASTLHKGHNLIGIKLLAQQKLNKMQDLNNDIQKNKIPRVKNTLQAAEQSVEKMYHEINVNIKTVVTQGEHLKELVDKSTAKTVFELEFIKIKIIKQLIQFKADSETAIKRLEDLMKESTEVRKSDNNVLIVDVEEHMSKITINEPQFVCDLATVKFVPGSDPKAKINAALGTIDYEQLQPVIPTQKLTFTKTVISKLQDLSIEPWSIQRTQQGKLWISEYNSTVLNRINNDGSKTTLTLDTPIKDICVGPVTDQLHCIPYSDTDTSIRTVDTKSGKTTKLFTTKTAPFCLNVTSNGHTFIVSTWCKPEVTLYDKNGTVLQTVTTVGNPGHIVVCRSTGMVAIACWEKGVMVMENKGDRLHHMYTYPTTGTSIYATGAKFDDTGHLLVTDSNKNHEVDIADAATGNTIQQIKVDGCPICLTTQKNGDIVFCTSDPNQLLTIKYM